MPSENSRSICSPYNLNKCKMVTGSAVLNIESDNPNGSIKGIQPKKKTIQVITRRLRQNWSLWCYITRKSCDITEKRKIRKKIKFKFRSTAIITKRLRQELKPLVLYNKKIVWHNKKKKFKFKFSSKKIK